MNVLADIPGNLIFLIVVAAVGAINWWLEQQKKKAAERENQDRPPERPQRRVFETPGPDSEQERLRKFLEALGVPQEPARTEPPPPPVAPPPMRETPPPVRRQPRPMPRPVAPSTTRFPSTTRSVPPPIRRPIAEPEEFAEAGRLEEPAVAIESIPGEFDRMSVAVTMQPMEPIAAAAAPLDTHAAPAIVIRRANAPIVENLRLALRTTADLRTALVAMEVLGKPRGLQD
jgi:hypothetical protein